MQLASTSRTTEVVRSADRKAPVTPPREPSWGRVLATTISLWTARRIPRLRRPGLALFLALVMLVTAAAVVAVVQLTTTPARTRSEEHTSELQSRRDLVCRLLLEKKK